MRERIVKLGVPDRSFEATLAPDSPAPLRETSCQVVVEINARGAARAFTIRNVWEATQDGVQGLPVLFVLASRPRPSPATGSSSTSIPGSPEAVVWVRFDPQRVPVRCEGDAVDAEGVTRTQTLAAGESVHHFARGSRACLIGLRWEF